ncbi:MAG: hypothetical protein ACM3X5_08200 [Bacillota bacterium]
MDIHRLKHLLFALILLASAVCAQAALAPADTRNGSAESLRAKAAELREPLARSSFGRPLVLTAKEENQRLTSEAYAVLEHGFAGDLPLASPNEWCDVLMLTFNTKLCAVGQDAGGTTLTMYVGRKYSTPLDQAFELSFRYRVLARTPNYLHVMLTADKGPFGTSDYVLHFELTPLDDKHSFLHLVYDYSFGTAARLMMQTYLATVGRQKVGFTVEGVEPSGNRIYTKGMRGVIERNTMRYYLAIESYLAARALPPERRTAAMAEAYFDANERFPRQLHEMERGEYLAMKLREYQRMRGASPVPRTASSLPSR